MVTLNINGKSHSVDAPTRRYCGSSESNSR